MPGVLFALLITITKELPYNHNMAIDINQPLEGLYIKFNTQDAFNTAYTCLEGNAFKFNTYRDFMTLKLFTIEQLEKAILHMFSCGVTEGINYNQQPNL